ncbi:MAG: hypothetical protein ACRDD2_10675 [Sarcina sp.]
MNNIDQYKNENNINTKEVFLNLDEFEDKYIIFCRLPGAVKEQISINYDNDLITISTFVTKSNSSSGGNFFISVTQNLYVSEEFYVPNINLNEITANYDGLYLNLELPKIITYTQENQEFIDVEYFNE